MIGNDGVVLPQQHSTKRPAHAGLFVFRYCRSLQRTEIGVKSDKALAQLQLGDCQIAVRSLDAKEREEDAFVVRPWGKPLIFLVLFLALKYGL